MEYMVHGDNSKPPFKVAVLIKEKDLIQENIEKYYVKPLANLGIHGKYIISFPLDAGVGKKPKASEIKSCLDNLIPKLSMLGVTHILCADSDYFKTLTNVRKAASYHGYVLPVKYPKDTEGMVAVLGLNHSSLFYQPTNRTKIDTSLKTITDSLNGNYKEPGSSVIKNGYFPDNTGDIDRALTDLHQYPELSCDIETFSLQIDKAGLGTIAFAWNEDSGIAFAVDHDNCDFGDQIYTRDYLKEFFENYSGKITYHGGSFDIKILIYELWMDNIDDIKGLLTGLEVMTKNIDDTMIITYLATNTTAGNKLSLKDIAQEFAGNYAQDDIKDITLIPPQALLEYNLVDCLSTNWVKNKYYPVMINDNQESIYKEIFLPSLKVLIQTELSGMCMDMKEVLKAEEILNELIWINKDIISSSPLVIQFEDWFRETAMAAKNLTLKKKIKPLNDFIDINFNPGSNKQVGQLLHEFIGLDIIDKTSEGHPATGNDSLKKLIHKSNEETTIIINAICDINSATKIVNTFIKAFKEKSILHGDGLYYLHGNFKLGGTVSGRLSSNSPNLMNLPSTSIYAEIIKNCFISPPNQLMVGADYNSLEDYISALTTRDKNKMLVYEQGYDGHALRTASYFSKEMPDIQQAIEGERCFKVGTEYIKCGTLVTCPNGEAKLIEEYFDALEKNRRLC